MSGAQLTAPNCAHLHLPFREQSWFSPRNDPGDLNHEFFFRRDKLFAFCYSRPREHTKNSKSCVRLSAGNKLVSEWVLSQMMKAGWIDYRVKDSFVFKQRVVVLEQCAHGRFALHASASAECFPGARYVTGERTAETIKPKCVAKQNGRVGIKHLPTEYRSSPAKRSFL